MLRARWSHGHVSVNAQCGLEEVGQWVRWVRVGKALRVCLLTLIVMIPEHSDYSLCFAFVSNV